MKAFEMSGRFWIALSLVLEMSVFVPAVFASPQSN